MLTVTINAAMPVTDYSTYLRIDTLLELQQPMTPGAADELLFIVVHQVYELWFRLAVDELQRARDALRADDLSGAVAALQRVTVIEELMLQQLRLLETMSPEGFLAFRDPLAPASGFQSTQFREIEYLCGVGEDHHAAAAHLTVEQRQALERRRSEPGLWEALGTCLAQRGMPLPPGEDATPRVAVLASIYRDHSEPARAMLHRVLELMVDLDEGLSRWRFHHALMAAREIGSRPGTGGSSGVSYLERTLISRCFPELWAVRTAL